MWVKVDDGFPEHHKVLRAGELLGPNGCGRVAAVWLEAMCYSNRHLTDGFIADSVARRFHLDKKPLDVLRAMGHRGVRLTERVRGGWRLHDYGKYQLSKEEIEEKRQKERDRKRRVRGLSARTDSPRPKVSGDPVPSRPVPSPDLDQEQRATRAMRFPQPVENPKLLAVLAHGVLDDADNGSLDSAAVTEELKTRAAKNGVIYGGDRIRKALDSVAFQREQRRA